MNEWRYVTLSVAFAFFVMCPRIAGMCAVLSRIGNVNPYVISVLGGLIAIPLISLMVFLTVRFGVEVAIAVAVLTDILSAIVMGTFKLRQGIEIILIALFIWLGVVVSIKFASTIESVIKQTLNG